MVSVLRVAHSAGITHGDIWPANMLIVPPPLVVARIAECRRDVLLELELIKSIDLTQCRFVLNDWGEAKIGKSSSELKISDIANLLRALSSPARLLAASHESTHRDSPLLAVNHHGGALPSLNPQVLRELEGLASGRDYPAMERRLSGAVFQVDWDRPQRRTRSQRQRQ